MIVVSDTSAITALLQIDHVHLLPQLFEKVVIPPAVNSELLRAHSSLPSFIETIHVKQSHLVHELERDVDLGEAEAIVLMMEGQGDLLIMDERRGRRIAQERGIRIIGLLGVLALAKNRGLIGSMVSILDQLESIAGFRISLELRTRVIEEARE